MDVIKRAYDKVANWFEGFWNRVKELVSKSWEALIKFMAIEPDVSFNNRISW
jgi:hypothetical protein